jgi:hypothetical protein
MDNERLAVIEQILKEQNKTLNDILIQVKSTNGRVTKLELWKAGVMGKVAGISGAIAVIGWLIANFFNK